MAHYLATVLDAVSECWKTNLYTADHDGIPCDGTLCSGFKRNCYPDFGLVLHGVGAPRNPGTVPGGYKNMLLVDFDMSSKYGNSDGKQDPVVWPLQLGLIVALVTLVSVSNRFVGIC